MNTRNSPRTLRDWPVYVQPKPGPSGSSPLCERLRRDGKWAVCSTADVPDKATHVMQIEDALIRRASARPGLACVVARADKKGQNLINRTGDRDGAGSAALALSMDVLAETMQTVYGAGCGKPFLMRDSPISDESTLIAAGDLNFLSRIGDARFNDIYGKVRRARMARLEEYQYDARKLVFGPGGREAVELVPMDLERYANALKNPELVAESHVSRPQVVPPEMLRPGFVHDAIIRAEGEELWFVPRMPAAFSPVLQSSGLVPELRKHKPMILPPGISAVEVKFSHTDEGDRRAR